MLFVLFEEFFSGDGFAAGVFRGDVGVFEGGEAVADVGDVHGGDVFEERDVGDEFGVARVAGPFGGDDCIGGLEGGVLGGGVEEEGAGEGAVEVGEVLAVVLSVSEFGKRGGGGKDRSQGEETYFDVFAVLIARGFSEERPHDDAIGIEFADYGVTDHGRLAGKNYKFVVLA